MSNSDKNYCVYIHTVLQKTSGYKYKKYYIGITNNVKKRWNKDGENYKNQVFYNAIQKYGWDNIKHQILFENLTKEKAMKKEIELIKKYKSKVGERGYNVSDGGEHISNKRTRCKNIYCIELGIAFRNSKEASKYTKENESSIYNKCKNYENGLYGIKKGYKYCFTNHIYKYFNIKTPSNVTIIVNLEDGKFMPNITKNIRIPKRALLHIDKYYNFKDRGILNNRQRYMMLNDYLYLFDVAKMSDFIQ